MSQHIKFIRKATSLPVYRLKNDIHSYVEGLQNNENESTKLSTFAAITGLRAETLNIAGVSKLYRRVYVLCPDSGTYFHVGWILNCDAENCMVCGTGFRSSSKHHCRACGNVVCDKCSKHRAVVSPLDHLGPLRVCNLCCFGQVSEFLFFLLFFFHFSSSQFFFCYLVESSGFDSEHPSWEIYHWRLPFG